MPLEMLEPVDPRVAARPRFDDVLSMFDYAVQTAPDTLALVHLGRRLTYAEEARAVDAIADALIARGLSGKVVALPIANSIEYHIGWLGCLRAHAIPAMMNCTFPEEALRPLFALAKPAFALTTSDQAEKIRDLGQGKDGMGFETLVFGEGDFTVENLVARGGKGGYAPAKPNENAILMYSGGTTGVSKGILHTHARLMRKVERIHWGWPTADAGEVWLPVAPFFHVYGLLMGFLNPIYGRATVVIPERFQPDLVVSMLAEHKVSVFGGGPPAIYGALLSSALFATADLSALYMCPGGGAPFPVEMIKRWKNATGLEIHEGYGMTEMAPISINNYINGVRVGSVGKVVPDSKIEIVDLDTGTRVLGPGQAGEIRIAGPHMFAGYLDNDAETKATIREGFCYTGDIGMMDEDGFLTITDRKKDVIFVNGFNVFPREVEEVLVSAPHVRMVGVVGTPCERTGEKVVAFVVGDGAGQPEELSLFCKEHLAPYKLPADIRFLKELPLTPAGKLDRMALARAAKEA